MYLPEKIPCCFAFLNFEGIFKLLVYKISNNHDWQLLILKFKYCINTNPYKNIQTFIKYCHCDNFPFQGHKTTMTLHQRESKIIVKMSWHFGLSPQLCQYFGRILCNYFWKIMKRRILTLGEYFCDSVSGRGNILGGKGSFALDRSSNSFLVWILFDDGLVLALGLRCKLWLWIVLDWGLASGAVTDGRKQESQNHF